MCPSAGLRHAHNLGGRVVQICTVWCQRPLRSSAHQHNKVTLNFITFTTSCITRFNSVLLLSQWVSIEVYSLIDSLIDKSKIEFNLSPSLWTDHELIDGFVRINLNGELSNLVQKFSEHYHDAWAKRKLENGWSYGEAWSEETKTHPRLKPTNRFYSTSSTSFFMNITINYPDEW